MSRLRAESYVRGKHYKIFSNVSLNRNLNIALVSYVPGPKCEK